MPAYIFALYGSIRLTEHIQTINMVNAFGVFDGTEEGLSFSFIWRGAVTELSVR